MDFPNSSTVKSADKPWTTLGPAVQGSQILDIREINVLDGNKTVQLNSLVNRPGKTKAVVHVVDLLPSGGVCGGCLNKGNQMYRNIRANASLAKDTTYIMILSGSYTPSNSTLNFAQRRVDAGVKVIRDINGTFQKTFATGNFPVTLVLESKYRGNILNMHHSQISAVIRTLNKLPR